MRMFKYIGALIAVLAFSIMGVATASAAEVLWPLLPGSVGETFKTSLDEGKAVLQEEPEVGAGTKIECSKLTGTGELVEKNKDAKEKKDATLALAVLDFAECVIGGAGLEVHSKGDPEGTILSHVDIHFCLIEWLKVKQLDGVLILPLEVLLENVGLGDITTVLDAGFVAPIKKIGVSQFLIDAKQVGGLQEVKLCEGGSQETLIALLTGVEKEVVAGEDVKALIKFDKKIDVEEKLT